MKFIAISDTHGQHRSLQLPTGDVIIHGGDFCHFGSDDNLYDFLEWFKKLDFEHKIFIGGNHDFLAAEQPEIFQSLLSDEITYLCNSGTKIRGINLWGSPYQPDLVGWAFGEKRGAEMKKHWDLIPSNIDILITHTPPSGILDQSRSGKSLGCEELSNKLNQLSIQYHIFGHVHESYGQKTIGNTTFINASNMNSAKGLVNKPIEFEL